VSRLLGTIGLALGSTALSLVVAEALVRVALPAPSVRRWDRAEVSDVGFSQIAGETVEGESNSLGLRGPEVPLESDGAVRVLALGVSFTYGFKLSNASSWPKQAESILRESLGREIEVLNGGRPDTDTRWQLDWFRSLGSRYEPDAVWIGFILNDCTDLSSSWDIVEAKRRVDALRREPEGFFASRLVRRLRVALQERRISEKTVRRFHRAYAEGAPGLERCRDAFRGFRDLAAAEGFELVVFVYPMLYRLAPPYPFQSIHDRMLAFWESEGIRAHDLTPAFLGRRDTDLWVQSDDSHPSREANAIAARRIAEIVSASGALAP